MDTETPIEIEHRPWFLAVILTAFAVASLVTVAMAYADGEPLAAVCAAILFIACLWAGAKAIRFARLTLRADGTACFEVRDLRGRHHREFTAGSLRAAVQHHRDGDGVTGRVMLLVDGRDGVERIPFSGHFSAGRRAADTVERIIDWRAETGPA